MFIGYMRVSKTDGSQTTDPQRDALLAAGVEADRIYQDLASGSQDDRPGLDAALKALREGDTLLVWKLDRLGRNLRHLVNTVHDLTSRGDRLQSRNRTRSINRHDDPGWQIGVRNLRGTGRVRAGTDFGENKSRTYLGTGQR